MTDSTDAFAVDLLSYLLVPVLIAAVEDGDGSEGAIPLLVEMGTVTAVPDLVRLAERDERILASGIADDLAWGDELLQAELRAAVTALKAHERRPE